MGERRTSFDRQLGASEDGRLDAPAFHRNVEPMLAVLRRRLGAATGHVLEIGSGTGQHVVRYAEAFPTLTWWPSDPDPEHRRSIDAWCTHSGAANVMPVTDLDAAASNGKAPAPALAAMIAMNVIHIAPWQVCQGIFRIAGRHLAPSGLLFLYGPFRRAGRHTAPSNESFDAMLRGQNPEWGVRDLGAVEKVAEGVGLRIDEIVEMPANNLTLVFQ